MPLGIFLYELNESLAPKVSADFYLEEIKVNQAILKILTELHISKGFSEVMHKHDNLNYFSRVLKTESISTSRLYLGFILREGEDLVSLKSIVEKNESAIIQKFQKDKVKLVNFLKGIISSILSLLEELKEPELIKAKMNKKAKNMLDVGNTSEARELIDLGDKIPEKLAEEVKGAEDLLTQQQYKKAAKRFFKAAELATQIKEEEIASFLDKKGKIYNDFPNFLKESGQLYNEIVNLSNEFKKDRLALYQNMIAKMDELINLANNFEKVEMIETLIRLKVEAYGASEVAKELANVEKNLKQHIDTMKL